MYDPDVGDTVSSVVSPRIDIEGIERVVFAYDTEDDIVYLHIGAPRPALTVEAGDGWNLRMADGEIVGLELHGFCRAVLSTTFFAHVTKPAIKELEQLGGASFNDGLSVQGSIEELPKTTRLLILMIGFAVSKLQDSQRDAAAEASRKLLGVG
jgi:hypothetical protein